jgi:sporulation protein YlmC with PRC-barrel domain
MLRSLNDMYGFTIAATDGDIGTVKDCYFDDLSYTVRYLVVETGGWLSGRKVLLSPVALRAMAWEEKRIAVALTKAQVEGSPDIDTDRPVSRQHEAAYFAHYDDAPYWAGSLLWGLTPYPYLAATPAGLRMEKFEHEQRWNWEARGPGDPHVRSARVVTGYHIDATDGDIGHVDDYLLDDGSWAIRYMVVDTSNWWAGKKVLVAPAWIEGVDWDISKVQVAITRAQVRDSPAYDPARMVERTYETQLYGHYGQHRYWRE